MSLLRVYADDNSTSYDEFSEFEAIKSELKEIGVHFERWQTTRTISDEATQEEILEAYKDSVAELMQSRGFQTADVISVNPETPGHPELRMKFLNEHTHSDDEARFFIDGKGLFCIHAEGKIYAMVCEKDDLINVPAGTKHWFDMGPQPSFKCIRVFTNKEGWVPSFTDSGIAEKFPRLG